MASLTDLKTPGVYVQEVSSFPPSIAQVPTAIPAFVGYTQLAINNGEDLTNKPTKVSSLLEFTNLFGAGYDLQSGNVTIKLDTSKNYSVSSITYTKVFYLYDSIREFYDNGGGDCYIVSVGAYTDTVTAGDETVPNGLRGGLKMVEQYDEPTLLVFPDAVLLSQAELISLQQMALLQCTDLQDRFSVLDLKENNADTNPWQKAVNDFRDQIGINSLSYGAAYTPWIYTSYSKNISFNILNGNVQNTGGTVLPLENLTASSDMNQLVIALKNANADMGVISSSLTTLQGTSPAVKDKYNSLKNEVITAATDTDVKTAFQALITYLNSVAVAAPGWLSTLNKNAKFYNDVSTSASDASTGLRKYVVDLIALEKNSDIASLDVPAPTTEFSSFDSGDANTWLGAASSAVTASGKDYGTAVREISLAALGDLDVIITGLSNFFDKISQSANTYFSVAQNIVFTTHPVISNVVTQLTKDLSKIPPSGAVVGVYAQVDGSRGVWKAPANVSLNSAIGPSVVIDDHKQENLNVDVNAGKSINAIRSFLGKGVIVWGARTLDGNSNDWRYVPVRRLYIMVEESVKKAASQFVFEPNDANTWTKIRAMIENYLTNLWRDGALAGAKPAQAFYVSIGLGITMTMVDVLEGRMIIEIGMAPVRPAEFIVLRFVQKMQES